MTEKQLLRQKIKAAIAAYSPEERLAHSQEVLRQAAQHPAFIQARTILAFHSMPSEVHTHDFLARYAGQKKLLLPVVVGNELELRCYTPSTPMVTNHYGIAEPMGEPFTQFDEIDLVLVPGLAFDPACHRMGRGKGYYDRLLPRLRAFKLAVCFSCQMLEHVPTDAHDVLMDAIISA